MPQVPHVSTCSNLFTPGRACPVTAVVLHEWKSGIENLAHEMCRCLRPRPLTSPGCHTSYHYGIAGNCNFQQYIDPLNTAWGFWYEPTPACPVPPCPIVQYCDGIGADQYNPEEDGTLATPVVAAGPDLSANCSVIHVAIASGAARTGSGIYCLGSSEFSPDAYDCLVESLCYIFQTAGLTPTGYSTLLTHVGELVDLDLTVLAAAIAACMAYVPPPLPPCNCTPDQTPLTVNDSPTLNLTASGVENHTLTGNVIISPTVGNTLVADAGGLLVPTVVQTPITANDTATVNLTASGTDNHTLAADVNVSATVGNVLVADVDGLFVPTPAAETPLTVNDSTSINFTASGTANHTLTGEVIIDPLAGNQLVNNAAGLYVPNNGLPATQDCSVAPIINLNGYQVFGTDADGSPATLSVYADPVAVLTGTILDITTQFAAGKRIFICNIDDQDLLISNHPDGACQYKEIWIKNINAGALTVRATPETIDGQASFILQPPIVLTASGDAIHLVWSSTLNTWFILSNYDNNNV